MGTLFVREVDGVAVERWYRGLTAVRDSPPGTAVRHFNVMHHMMEKASRSGRRKPASTGIPADQVEVKRPDDQRDRYLSEEEIRELEAGARREDVPARARRTSTRRFTVCG